MDSETLRKYHSSYEKMLKTVSYRGYIVPDDLLLDRSQFDENFSEFESVDDIKESIGDLLFESATKLEDRLLLRWVKDRKLGMSIRNISNTMISEGASKALIVADEGINPASKETLKNLKVCYALTIDVWSLQESMIFPPDHVYTPTHRICTLKEKKALYKAYGLKNKDLPRIKPDDVMVKYLGASRKQIIQITRKSDTNPDLYILYYRIVL